MRPGVSLECLLKLQEFFADGGRDRQPVPLKERSLQIFGDEKRLDALFRGIGDTDRLAGACLEHTPIGAGGMVVRVSAGLRRAVRTGNFG